MLKTPSECLEEMVEMQDRLNMGLHKDWKYKDWDFNTAIMVEAAEMLDHLGYKWWKTQQPDIPQAQMELVDIWHFLLSLAIRDEPSLLKYPRSLNIWDYPAYDCKDTTVETVQALVHKLIKTNDIAEKFSYYAALRFELGLNTADLYKWYIGKNCLNDFRWKHGYDKGEYRKIWNGEEDNVFLTRILEDPKADRAGKLYNYVWNELDLLYKSVIKRN